MLKAILIGVGILVTVACTAAAPQPTPTTLPAPTLEPAQANTPIPTATPAPTPELAPSGNALDLYDDNGNGRITCAEAEAHGIAPVHRGHPAYEHMTDRDGDGVVCE